MRAREGAECSHEHKSASSAGDWASLDREDEVTSGLTLQADGQGAPPSPTAGAHIDPSLWRWLAGLAVEPSPQSTIYPLVLTWRRVCFGSLWKS